MPVVLNGELTEDEYAGGPEFSADRNTKQIVFLGTGAPYFARFFKINPSDPIGQPVLDGTEQLYPAGSGDSLAANIGGVQFRSAVKGVPATIYGRQAYATDVLTSAPAFGGGTQACCGGSGEPLDVTDGVIDVNPTTQIVIGAGLTLSNPSPGVAQIDDTDAGAGIEFNTDNEGGFLFVRSNNPITGIGVGYNGFGLALVDGADNGIIIDSDNEVNVNTVQNGSFTFGQPNNSQQFIVNGGLQRFHVGPAQTFTVEDHLGNPIFQLTG